MKKFWVVSLIWCLGLGALWGQTPEEQYITIYNTIQQGDTLSQGGQTRGALDKYLSAQTGLKRLQTVYPSWNEKVVKFRLNYLNEKITPLLTQFPATNSASGLATTRGSNVEISAELDAKLRNLENQVRLLTRDRELLEAKLKESLSVRPVEVDPRQVAKAESKAAELQKENDLLKITIEQQKSKGTDGKELQSRVTSLSQQLDQTRTEIAALQKTRDTLASEKSALEKNLQTLTQSNAALTSSRETVEKQMADTKNLLATHEQQIKKFQDEKNGLEEKVRQLTAGNKTDELNSQLAQMKTQLASLTESQAKLTREKSALEKKLQDTPSTATALEKDLKELQRTSSAQQTEIRRLQDEKLTLEKRLQQPGGAGEVNMDRTRELTRDLTAARLALQVKESTLQALQSEKVTLIARLKEISLNKVSLAMTNTSDLERQLLESRATLRKRDQNYQQLEKDKAALEARLNTASTPVTSSPAVATVSDREKQLEQDLTRARAEILRKDQELSTLASRKTEPETKPEPLDKEDRKRIKKLESDRDDLEKRVMSLNRDLAQARKKSPAGRSNIQGEVDMLRARLAVLEAQPMPYSAEEMALFKKPETVLAKVEPKAGKKSVKDLPAGAGPLVAEAERAFAAKRFEEAEAKYLQVLRQDEKNVYTLANLAAIELELKRMDEAEKYLKQALAVDADDAYSLALMGILRFQQNRTDEALESLSRSAQVNPQSAETQNYLGIALSQKGQRQAAEAALRKAIQIQPGYGSAHHNLAVVYATQKPPYLELARWHYDKALAAGHPRNEELDKLLKP